MEVVEITRNAAEVQTGKRPISQIMDSSDRFKCRFRKVRSTFVAFPLLALSLIALAEGRSFGRPGDLDPSFGSNGIVATSLGSMADHTRRLRSQPDGKILVLYTSGVSPIITPTTGVIERFLPNGIPDTSFAAGGRLSVNGLRDFEILVDGHILTIATIYSSLDYGRVCRWSRDGMLDMSFGTQGCTNLSYASGFEARRIRLFSNGHILVAGVTESYVALFAKLKPDGTIDQSFGLNGLAPAGYYDFSYYRVGPWVIDKTGEVAIQPDGKILFGYSQDWDNYFYIGRLNQDGSVDTSFGESGVVSIGIPVPSYAYDAFSFGIANYPDERIVVSGTAVQWYGTESQVITARLRNNGSLDSTFGSGGLVGFLSNDTRGPASSMLVLTNGKILLGGMDDQAFSLLRLNADGSFDTRFGNNGIIQTRFGTSNMTSILAMELQNDGSLIAAGSINGANWSANIGLAKYRDVAAVPAGTQYDFDGDGKADISVFRPSEANWYLNRSSSGFYVAQFGLSTDVITPADYDGDGKTDISVFRDGTWYWLSSSNGQFNARQFGQPSDVPVPADYTGDGRADLGVYRNGVWWVQDLVNGTSSVASFGLPTDRPVAADYDGDGRTDITVFRDGEWHLQLSGSVYSVIRFGVAGDLPMIGDFDGDGRSDLAVYREGVWHVQRSTAGYTAFPFGLADDLPVPADYDGDGKADAAIYRGGTWWVQQSFTQTAVVAQFGIETDTPVPHRSGAN